MRRPGIVLLRGVAFASLLLLTAPPVSSPAEAATVAADEVFSVFLALVVAAPNPVLGADDKVHLAYELLLVNPTRLAVRVERIEALGGEGATLADLGGEGLAAMMKIAGGGGTTLGPGGSAYIFLDVALAKDRPLPAQLTHRLTATRMTRDDKGVDTPLTADLGVPADASFIGAPTAVGEAPAVVIAPPLRGDGWLAVNGCCDALTSHRGAVLAINGAPYVPERFAIDFARLDDEGRLFTGPVDELPSYAYFGTPVHTVADGTVVNLDDGLPEQVPGAGPAHMTPAEAGGNFVVVDIGRGHFAFFAHLQPGSLTVKLGDRVKTGDVIGLLGNSGNTTAPHLHFHMMDGPSPLVANGLPYTFTAFASRGTADNASLEATFDKGERAVIDKKLAGGHEGQLPLNNQVVDFGE